MKTSNYNGKILLTPGASITRIQALESLLSLLPDTVPILATTGKTGRELFTLQDHAKHFYQVGSMDCCNAVGLGVAANFRGAVVVLDGDGALLMKMGNMTTIGAYSPSNLIHILLDNGVHDSTGGQHTVSTTTDFSEVALACSYRNVFQINRCEDIAEVLKQCLANRGPSFIHIRVKPGSLNDLARPTIAPSEVALRFRNFLTITPRVLEQ